MTFRKIALISSGDCLSTTTTASAAAVAAAAAADVSHFVSVPPGFLGDLLNGKF
jgi:hypothetical protein